jgi:hypothetical protein
MRGLPIGTHCESFTKLSKNYCFSRGHRGDTIPGQLLLTVKGHLGLHGGEASVKSRDLIYLGLPMRHTPSTNVTINGAKSRISFFEEFQ